VLRCAVLRRNDPNYDSDEESTVFVAPNSSHTKLQEEVAAYKREVGGYGV
jgi:hypothetical protein